LTRGTIATSQFRGRRAYNGGSAHRAEAEAGHGWWGSATGARSPRRHGGRASSPSGPMSVLHGFGEDLRWCVQVVGAEQNGVLDAHGLAAHRGELRDDVLGGGVVRERGQVRGVRPERGDAAAQRLTRDLDAVGRAKAGEPADDEPAYGMRLQVFVVDLLRENPPVARVAHRVERREPGRAVVGLVEAIGRLDVVPGAEYHVGLEPADLPADAAAKVEAVDEHAVRMFEDGQVLDADDGAGGLLLGDAQACRLLGRGRHAGLAAGAQGRTDLHAPRSPASDGRGRAVLHVVRVRDDAEHTLEGLLGKGRQRHAGHPPRTVPRRGWTGSYQRFTTPRDGTP